jgi:hypothetical protein
MRFKPLSHLSTKCPILWPRRLPFAMKDLFMAAR